MVEDPFFLPEMVGVIHLGGEGLVAEKLQLLAAQLVDLACQLALDKQLLVF